MATPQALDANQMAGIKRRFFFTRDVENFELSIFDRMDDDDSYHSISSRPLIEDHSSDRRPCPIYAYLYCLSSMENVFLDISTNQTFWTSESLNLLLSSSSRLVFPFEEYLKSRFHRKIGGICRLDSKFLFFLMRNEQP